MFRAFPTELVLVHLCMQKRREERSKPSCRRNVSDSHLRCSIASEMNPSRADCHTDTNMTRNYRYCKHRETEQHSVFQIKSENEACSARAQRGCGVFSLFPSFQCFPFERGSEGTQVPFSKFIQFIPQLHCSFDNHVFKPSSTRSLTCRTCLTFTRQNIGCHLCARFGTFSQNYRYFASTL